ncbi:hypothetical protein ACU21_05635 [Actinobaculum suis]|nr:hypothetical protein ACU20_06285 [Actinobaculum suis]OCA94806.1 hypothetical protein ACU21_05635 [Actinobaculum suis]
MISTGTGDELTRQIDVERCRRIGWIGIVIDWFNADWPEEERIKWWVSSRRMGNTRRYLIATNDFAYVVIVDERPEYAVLVTAYYVNRAHRQRKLRNEHAEYWKQQGPPI